MNLESLGSSTRTAVDCCRPGHRTPHRRAPNRWWRSRNKRFCERCEEHGDGEETCKEGPCRGDASRKLSWSRRWRVGEISSLDEAREHVRPILFVHHVRACADDEGGEAREQLAGDCRHAR